MSLVQPNDQGSSPYVLPKHFNINKTDGDDNVVNKSEAISLRVDAIFSQNKGKIAAFAILTLPLFPITWSIGYAIVRHSAKSDVVKALAKKNLELLGEGGEIRNLLNKARTGGTNTWTSVNEACAYQHSSLTQISAFNFIKKSDLNAIIMSDTLNADPTLSDLENWNAFKTKGRSNLEKMCSKYREVNSKFKWSEKKLDEFIFMKFKLPERNNTNLSSATRIIEALQEIDENETDLLNRAASLNSKQKKISLRQEIKKSIDVAINNALGDIDTGKISLSITNPLSPDHFLSVHDTLLRDAKGSLPAYRIEQRQFNRSPNYSVLAPPENGYDSLQGDNEDKFYLKKMVTERLLNGIIPLYEKASANLSTVEKKLKLWTMLHLSLTQGYLSPVSKPLHEEIIKMVPIGRVDHVKTTQDSGLMIYNIESQQNAFVEYHYDEKTKSLSITTHQRMNIKDLGCDALMSHYIYSKVKVTIDLASDEVNPICSDISTQALPVSQRHPIFDRLPSRETITSLEQI